LGHLGYRWRTPQALDGGTTFTFVTEGIAAVLELARRAAGGLDVSLAGGARAAQQYLDAGLVDEMEIHLVPVLVGGGERPFEGVKDLGDFQHVRTVAAPGVTHPKFVRR
jgi:dihydrofolate reductase